MSISSCLYYLSVCLTLCLCISCQEANEERPDSFFLSKRYNGDYATTLDLLKPDSVMRHIRDEVPPKWYGLACESAYYHIPEGTSDSIILRHLDLYEQWFPHDTVSVFSKTLRGKTLLRQNRYDTAIACLNEAYLLSVKTHSPFRMGDVTFAMGEFYTRQGNYPEAIKKLLVAYNHYLELPVSKNQSVLFETMLEIGNAYRGGNDYVSAQVWHLSAWRYANARKWAKGFKVHAAAAVADNYWQLNQLDSAKLMIDTAFYYQNLYKIDYNQASRYYILGKVLLKQGDCRQALANFWVAQRRNLRTSDLVVVNRYNEGLGNGYLCLGRLDSAIWFYQKALAKLDTARQAAIHKQLSIAFTQKGQYELALKHERESRRISDRFFTLEKNKAVIQLQNQNEIERGERQLAEEISQNKITQLLLIVGILVLSILLLLGFSRIRRQKQAWQLAEQEKELLRKEKELVEAREALKTKALVVVRQKLDSKEKALKESNKQLNLKDLLIQELKMSLKANIEKEIEPIPEEQLQNLKILTTEDWRAFRKIFEQRYPDYFDNLVERFPKLSAAEIRLLVLIKIGFDANEMANILGISASSVYKSRYRLRKKLGLIGEDDLEQFVHRF